MIDHRDGIVQGLGQILAGLSNWLRRRFVKPLPGAETPDEAESLKAKQGRLKSARAQRRILTLDLCDADSVIRRLEAELEHPQGNPYRGDIPAMRTQPSKQESKQEELKAACEWRRVLRVDLGEVERSIRKLEVELGRYQDVLPRSTLG